MIKVTVFSIWGFARWMSPFHQPCTVGLWRLQVHWAHTHLLCPSTSFHEGTDTGHTCFDQVPVKGIQRRWLPCIGCDYKQKAKAYNRGPAMWLVLGKESWIELSAQLTDQSIKLLTVASRVLSPPATSVSSVPGSILDLRGKWLITNHQFTLM